MSAETIERAPVTTWRQILAVAGAAVLTVAALAPLTLGYVAGVTFWALRWLAAALVVGFAAGNRSDGA